MPILKKNRRYEISGDITREIEETVLKECTTEDFLENIKHQLSMQIEYKTGVLPKGCLSYRSTRELEVYVIELPPKVLSIKFKQVRRKETEEQPEVYRLSLPFVQMYVGIQKNSGGIQDVRLSCTKLPVQNETDPVFVLPLPNQYSGGHENVCTGDIRIPQDLPISSKVKKLVEDFFTSGFNTDLSTTYPDELRYKVNETVTLLGIAGWAKNTEENAMFGITDTVQYQPHRHLNMDGIMGRMING